jgi:hypothetical protein
LIRILPRSHHQINRKPEGNGSSRQNFERVLAILNLPEDKEGTWYTGGMIAELGWDRNFQEEEFVINRNALNQFAHYHRITDSPSNLNSRGELLKGNRKGKPAAMWSAEEWIIRLDGHLYNRGIKLQKKIIKSDEQYKAKGQTVIYFYDENNDQVSHVDITNLSPSECPFKEVYFHRPEEHVPSQKPNWITLKLQKKKRKLLLPCAIIIALVIFFLTNFKQTEDPEEKPFHYTSNESSTYIPDYNIDDSF